MQIFVKRAGGVEKGLKMKNLCRKICHIYEDDEKTETFCVGKLNIS